MKICVIFIFGAFFLQIISLNTGAVSTMKRTDLVGLYDYYTSGGITEGLNADQPYFTLNTKNISIYSGSFHYFRTPKQYWRDRLRRIRSTGLNAIETYVAWNLHEPTPGVYDFGDGGTDFENFLDLEYLFKSAVDEDLFIIIRPGPYICAEWEYGGFPSWLVNEENITLRSSSEAYMKHVRRYFGELLPRIAKYQFQNKGPVIAIQVENEYASRSNPDMAYLEELVSLMKDNGIVELLVTSDAAGYKDKGSVPEALKTANFGGDPSGPFGQLLDFQPGRPVMAMEHYGGWFDHWTEGHHTTYVSSLNQSVTQILQYPGSFNIYMYEGGTNFGFLSGANYASGSRIQPTTTSYDYDAPLNEAGDYKSKYYLIADLLSKYNPVQTLLPDPPIENPKYRYPATKITHRISFEKMLNFAPHFQYENVVNMEALPINNNTGQQYGFINYRKTGIDIDSNSTLLIEGYVCDSVIVLVNNVLISKPLTSKDDLNSFGYWRLQNGTLNLGSLNVTNATLDLLVQNWGRVNYGDMSLANTKKGLWQGNVLLNGQVVQNWTVYPLEFRSEWINTLTGWESVNIDDGVPPGPALYKADLETRFSYDTYVNTTGWNTGFMAVNGFNLGRYTPLGPQRYLYIPAPLFTPNASVNQFVIFENFNPHPYLEFLEGQIFKSIKPIDITNRLTD